MNSIASNVGSTIATGVGGVSSSVLGLVDDLAQQGFALDDSVVVPDQLWGDNLLARRLQGHGEPEGDFLSLFFDLMFVGIGTQVVNSIGAGVATGVQTGNFSQEMHCFGVFVFLFASLSYVWFDAQLFFAVLSVRSSGHVVVFGTQVVALFLVINSLGEAGSVTSSFGIRWPYTLMGFGLSRANAALTWRLVRKEAAAAKIDAHSLFLQWSVRAKCASALLLLALLVGFLLFVTLKPLPELAHTTEVLLSLALVLVMVVDAAPLLLTTFTAKRRLDERAHPPGATVRHLASRCGEYILLQLGEPLVTLPESECCGILPACCGAANFRVRISPLAASASKECHMSFYLTSKILVLPLYFSLAMLYFGCVHQNAGASGTDGASGRPRGMHDSQAGSSQAGGAGESRGGHLLTSRQSRSLGVLWLLLHVLLGFFVLCSAAGVAQAFDEVAARRVGLGSCERGLLPCQCFNRSDACLNHSAQAPPRLKLLGGT